MSKGRAVVRDDGERYASIEEAARAAGTTASNMRVSVTGVGFAIGGHMYALEGDEMPAYRERAVSRCGRPVAVVREDGARWDSIKDCARAVGACKEVMSRELNRNGRFVHRGMVYRRAGE